MPKLKKLKQELNELLERELRVLRDMLESLQEEQQALLKGATQRLKLIVEGREEIFNVMNEVHDLRIMKVKQICDFLREEGLELEKEASLKEVLEKDPEFGHEIVIVRDQLIELLKTVEEYNERNNYLIKSRSQLTQDMIQKLHPQNGKGIYGPKAKKKVQVSTMTIINHEV